MAKFNAASEMDNYGGQGGAGFFSLKNDKDVAQVRFLYNAPEDVEGYAVHEVEVDGKKRWVNCLRAYNEPLDKCPLCRERYLQQVRLFIPLYDVNDGRVKIWERGKKFYSTLSGIFARVKGNIVGTVFEIERNGKPGDTQTTYGIYAGERDNTRIEDLVDDPKVVEVLGGILLDKTAEDMEYYLEEKQFPPDDDNEMPVRRRGNREDEMPVRRGGGTYERRTPSRRGGNNGDDNF